MANKLLKGLVKISRLETSQDEKKIKEFCSLIEVALQHELKALGHQVAGFVEKE